jgi:hypothetical protein
LDSKVETYSGGLPKGQVKYKDNSITDRKVSTNVSNALKEISSFPFTITSATSTEEEDKALGRESKTHLEGRAIDVRYDDQGHKLVSWITGTSEGNSWAKKHGASILPHGEGGQLHYHIQFNRQQTKAAETKPTVKPAAQQPQTPVKVNTPPMLQRPVDNGYDQFMETIGAGNMFEVSENINFPKPVVAPKTTNQAAKTVAAANKEKIADKPAPPAVKVQISQNKVAQTKQALDKAVEENPLLRVDKSFQELYSNVVEGYNYLNNQVEELSSKVQQGVTDADKYLDDKLAELSLFSDNIASWSNRFFVKNFGIGDMETEVVENKAGTIKIAKAAPVKPAATKNAPPPVEVEPRQFKELGKTGEGHWRFYNKFDRNQGFEYIPIKNVGHSTAKDSYQAKGMAHFLLDVDVTGNATVGNNLSTDGNFIRQESFNYIHQTIRDKKPAGSPGSTVNDPFMALYKKTEDGKVLVTYQPLSTINSEKPLKNTKLKPESYHFSNQGEGWTTDDEVYKGFKILAPLRQYKYSDFNWNGKTEAMFVFNDKGKKVSSFNSSVASIPLKNSYDVKNPKTGEVVKSTSSQFIFPSGSKNGKSTYGKFGGGAVVFLSPKKSFAIDFTGSIDEINSMAKSIIKDYGLSEDDLIMGFHDLGSFSAKPGAKNNKISFSQWSGFNPEHFTGGGLAIP